MNAFLIVVGLIIFILSPFWVSYITDGLKRRQHHIDKIAKQMIKNCSHEVIGYKYSSLLNKVIIEYINPYHGKRETLTEDKYFRYRWYLWPWEEKKMETIAEANKEVELDFDKEDDELEAAFRELEKDLQKSAKADKLYQRFYGDK